MLQPHILVTSQEDRYPWSCHCPTPSHSAGPIPKIHLLTCPPLYPHSTCSRSHLDSAPDSSHPLKPDSDSHHYSQTWQSSPDVKWSRLSPPRFCSPSQPVPSPFRCVLRRKGGSWSALAPDSLSRHPLIGARGQSLLQQYCWGPARRSGMALGSCHPFPVTSFSSFQPLF